MRQCQQAQHGINCLLELCCPHVYFSSSLDHLILYERLIYKTSSCLSHEYVFSCIVCWWPHSINKLGWCCSPCSAFRMKEEGGEWVSHRIHSPPPYPALLSLTGFSPCPPPDISPWSTEGHEYSTKRPLFIAMQQRSVPCPLHANAL